MRYIPQKQPILKGVYVCDLLHARKHTALGSRHRGQVGVGRVLAERRYAQLYEAGARGVVERRPRRPCCVSSLPRASRHHHSIRFALAAGGRDNETLPSDEKGSPCAPMILITTFPMS